MAIILVDGFNLRQQGPLDQRTVFPTKENALASLYKVQRYVGLEVYITEEQRKYIFQGGIENENLVPVTARPDTKFYALTFEASDFDEHNKLFISREDYDLGDDLRIDYVRLKLEDNTYSDVLCDYSFDPESGVIIEADVPFDGKIRLSGF